MSEGLKTPLYDAHVAAEGKIVPFAGYLLPIQYPTGIITEHMAVREKMGLFDVSHMGEFSLTGKDALANLNNLLSNDMTSMVVGRCRYSPMLNEVGGILDDLLVYKRGEESYWIVVNASNRHSDYAWMAKHLFGDAKLVDESDEWAQVALQGPLAIGMMERLVGQDALPQKYYTFLEDVVVGGVSCLVSRTGYTGELGYELYCAAADGEKLWNYLLAEGKADGLIPCALGARDTLRLEAGMPLYGHEMTEDVNPFEAGLDPFVKMAKETFIGKAALEAAGEPTRIRVGLEVTGRGIVREEADIYAGDRLVGKTTSGTHCPYVGKAVAMAMVAPDVAALDTVLEADVRGRRVPVKVVAIPFYKRS